MKVTEESIKAKIKAVHCFQPLGTLTICVLELANGFNVVGKSACVDPATFDEATGRDLAYRAAFQKMWELEGYLLAERLNEQPADCCNKDAP